MDYLKEYGLSERPGTRERYSCQRQAPQWNKTSGAPEKGLENVSRRIIVKMIPVFVCYGNRFIKTS